MEEEEEEEEEEEDEEEVVQEEEVEEEEETGWKLLDIKINTKISLLNNGWSITYPGRFTYGKDLVSFA